MKTVKFLVIAVLVLAIAGAVAFAVTGGASALAPASEVYIPLAVSGNCQVWRHGNNPIDWSLPGTTTYCDEDTITAFGVAGISGAKAGGNAIEPTKEEFGAAAVETDDITRSVTVYFAVPFGSFPLVLANSNNPHYTIAVVPYPNRVTFTAVPVGTENYEPVTIFWQARGPYTGSGQ